MQLVWVVCVCNVDCHTLCLLPNTAVLFLHHVCCTVALHVSEKKLRRLEIATNSPKLARLQLYRLLSHSESRWVSELASAGLTADGQPKSGAFKAAHHKSQQTCGILHMTCRQLEMSQGNNNSSSIELATSSAGGLGTGSGLLQAYQHLHTYSLQQMMQYVMQSSSANHCRVQCSSKLWNVASMRHKATEALHLQWQMWCMCVNAC